MTEDEAYALFQVGDLFPEPKGRGLVSVERQLVFPEMVAAHPDRYRPGWLTTLWLGHRRATTDSWGEFREQWDAIQAARGRVLVHGLGLGAVLRPMLAKPEVESVEVVEWNADVCRLVAPAFGRGAGRGPLQVTLGDAYTADLGDRRWDVVYSDIWVDDEDHSAEHERIRAVYAGRCDEHLCWTPS